MSVTIKRLVLVALLVAMGVGAAVVATQIQTHDGFFSPVFGPDGRHVYFIGRHTRGLVAGFGWESFSPPAHVFVWTDRFSLQKLSLATGDVDVLATFPPSPVEDRRLRTYRGRAFTSPSTLLRWEDDGLAFRIRLSIPTQPSADMHFLSGAWTEDEERLANGSGTPIEWTQDWTEVTGDDESPLFGRQELMTVKGREAFPCAIVSQDADSTQVDVLIENDDCEEIYPNGIAAPDVAVISRRADIERVNELTSTHDRLMKEAMDGGMPEYDASLHVLDQMRDLGYYPQPPQYVATLLNRTDVETRRAAGDLAPLFVIEEMQFTVGLFQDLERALDSPGIATERSMGTYTIHRDYSTSQALNEFLAGDGTAFYVERGDNVFKVELLDP